jgi:hypothetical protein
LSKCKSKNHCFQLCSSSNTTSWWFVCGVVGGYANTATGTSTTSSCNG